MELLSFSTVFPFLQFIDKLYVHNNNVNYNRVSRTCVNIKKSYGMFYVM